MFKKTNNNNDKTTNSRKCPVNKSAGVGWTKVCEERSLMFRVLLSLNKWLTAKQSVLLRIQVRASSKKKGLERGWKQIARLRRDAKNADCPFCIRYIRSNYPLLPPTGNSHSPHTLRALSARKTLTPRFTDFFTDFEKKKTRLFCSLQMIKSWGLT